MHVYACVCVGGPLSRGRGERLVQAGAREPKTPQRYAGASFERSPAPASLPRPSHSLLEDDDDDDDNNNDDDGHHGRSQVNNTPKH